MEFTEEQLRIINSNAKLKRVIACAGSGKTWVITKSIIEILNKNLCNPSQILGLTFTKNAAENMRKRIRDNVEGISFNEIDIYTFNAFGNEIIKENSFKLDLGNDYSILNSAECWRIIYEIFKNYAFENIKIKKSPGKAVQKILDFIESLKNNLIFPEDFSKYLNNYEKILENYKSKALMREEKKAVPIQKELLSIYRLYEKFKIENNSVDYGDQVFLPYSLLTQNKDLKNYYSSKYKYIFVDEFQDTNIAQAHLLSLLNNNENKMTIVGDDDQGIYSFRGACVENILNFHEWENFSGTKVNDYYLTINFRSGKKIIGVINDLISKNEDRFSKQLQPSKEDKESEIIFFNNPTHEVEAERIARMINKLKIKGIKLREIAIFSRKKDFNQISQKLDYYNIKYELVGKKTFYYEKEVLFIIAWLNVIYDIFDEINLVYLLKSDKYKICDRDIYFLKRGPNGNTINLIEGIRKCKSNKYVSRAGKERLSLFIFELKNYIKKSKNYRLKELISFIYKNSGMKDELNSRFGQSVKKKIKNIETLIRVANDFEEEIGENDLESFNVYLKDVAKTDFEGPQSLDLSKENSVKIMSIHAAKGLEFEVVFLPRLWKNDYLGKNKSKNYIIPSYLRSDNKVWIDRGNYTSSKKFKNDLKKIKKEEERRIFYVACSRAKKLLILSHSNYEDENDKSKRKSEREIVPFFKDIVNNKDIKLIDHDDMMFMKKLNENCDNKIENFDTILDQLEKDKKAIMDIPDINWDRIEESLIKELDTMEAEDVKFLEVKEKRKENEKIFSLTKILDYMKCPTLYKWKYIYKIPEPPNKFIEIGEKVHFAIEKLTRLKLKDNGFNESKLLKKLDDELLPYIQKYISSVFFDLEKIKNSVLEQLIYLKLEDYVLTTKLDRLDRYKNHEYKLIDYKVSNYSKENPIHINQLKAYAVAVSDIFGVDFKNLECILFYLKNNKLSNHYFSEKTIDLFKEKLLAAIEKINSNFFPKKKKSFCRSCYYKNYCGN